MFKRYGTLTFKQIFVITHTHLDTQTHADTLFGNSPETKNNSFSISISILNIILKNKIFKVHPRRKFGKKSPT